MSLGPVARPPMNAASDIGEAGRLLGAGAGGEASEGEGGAGERLRGLGLASSPMSLRRASSWFRCFCSSVNGSSETTTCSSAFMTAATALLARVSTVPQGQRHHRTDTLLTEFDAVGPTAHVGAPPHASLPRGGNLSFKPPGLRLLIVIHLLLHCLDLICPFCQGCIGLRWNAECTTTVHDVRVNVTCGKEMRSKSWDLNVATTSGYMRRK